MATKHEIASAFEAEENMLSDCEQCRDCSHGLIIDRACAYIRIISNSVGQ